MTVCRKKLVECLGRTQCSSCTVFDVRDLCDEESPTAWVGPQGQLVGNSLYELWAAAEPEKAKGYQRMYTQSQVITLAMKLVQGYLRY